MAEFVGASVADVRRLAEVVKQQAEHIERDVVGSLQRHLAGSTWVGADAESFTANWQSQLAPGLLRVAAALLALHQTLIAQAGQQEQASAPDTGVAASGTPLVPKATHRKPPDFDDLTPASPEQVREIELRMRVLQGQHAAEHFPEAYLIAREWAKELQAGNPSAADVEAFRRYCFLMATAHINRAGVAEAANIACESFESADNAKVDAAASTISLLMPGPDLKGMQAVINAGIEMDIDTIRSAATERLVHGLQNHDPTVITAAYDSQADSYLASLADSARSTTELWGTDAAPRVMGGQIDAFSGRVEELRYDQLADSSTEYMTGSDNLLDKSLRGFGSAIPVLGAAFDASSALGNTAHAALATGTGQHALEVASVVPINNLRTAAQLMGIGS